MRHIDPVPGSAPSAKAGVLSRWRHRDHTRGNLFASLMVLSLPLLASSIFGGVLFQIVDLRLVSGLGEDAVTAVVVTNQSLRQVVFMLVMGASFGAQGLIARSIGQSKRSAGSASYSADHITGQVIFMGAIFWLLVATLGITFAEPLLSGMNVSQEVLEIGLPYVRLVFLLSYGFIFINLFNAILNGAGDTTIPLVVAIVQSSTALVGEWLLIYGRFGLPEFGIRGVALGIGFGQLCAIFFVCRVLLGGKSRIHVRRHHLRPDPAAMRTILALSWPPAIQMIGGFLVTVFFIRLMGDFGPKAQAAYSIGLRLSMLGPMLCFPIAGAVATLVGQALGAGNLKRAWRAMGVGILVHDGLMWAIAACFYFARDPLLQFFTQDPEVLAIGNRMLAWQAGSLLLLAFYFVFLRSLQGAGDVVIPMAFSVLSSLLFSLPLGLYLSKTLEMGPDGLFMAQFASTLFITVLTGGWVATGRWAKPKRTA